MRLRVCRLDAKRIAGLGPLLGVLLILASIATLAHAADAPAQKSWAELLAERERLAKQCNDLVAKGKTDEAIAVAGKLFDVDRVIATGDAKGAVAKETKNAALLELIKVTESLVTEHSKREEWSTAANRQGQLAEIYGAIYGKTDYRASDARNDQTYYARLATLTRENAPACQSR